MAILIFYCACYSFATLHLNLGTSIFIVSKMHDHPNITTTQIYINFIDHKKEKLQMR
ncbi:MAG: hypothetical protein ACOYJF_11370 [Prevotella sp.]